jgi:hypothetical protein
MTDNKTLDLIIYRFEDAKRQSDFDLTLPPSFKGQSPFYQIRVLFPEHTASAALFSISSECPDKTVKISAHRSKRDTDSLTFIYTKLFSISSRKISV